MSTTDIAIIGLACRFPGALDATEFWDNLCAGRESIHFFTDDELRDAGVPDAVRMDPHYIAASPILKDADCFDAHFFDYSPREARIIDPQQRLFLQIAWHAFEDAGYTPRTIGCPVGVFAGAGGVVTSYLVGLLRENPDLLNTTGSLEHLGNDKDFIATRIAYKLNLTGPAITVQTACSTSIVALHLACQSLLAEEIDFALVGAASVRVPHYSGYRAHAGDILSSDGHCRPFDANADGTIFGSGVGAVLLRPLNQALEARDPVYAVIKATALNNDGSNKVSYTASSVEGQARAMIEAMTLSKCIPNDIGYIECHGTGTAVGDPLEIGALHQAFGVLGGRSNGRVLLGSVKSNIGHLEQAAGIAALIKTALALKHGRIPPSRNFTRPNPKIDFDRLPFTVATKLTDWKTPKVGGLRRACVNSLGLGGTNAFVVLEQAPELPSQDDTKQPFPPSNIAILSARSNKALQKLARKHADWFSNHRDIPINDICHTLTTGRTAFEWRSGKRIIDANDYSAWLESIAKVGGSRMSHNVTDPLVFLFTGQGAQYPGMGATLYRQSKAFRAHVDHCAEQLKKHMDIDLREVLFDGRTELLEQTQFSQPALFTIETGLNVLWSSWGVNPDAVIGHSVGEFAAAVAAGILRLEDGLELIAERGRLMQSLPNNGGMTAIATNVATAELLLADVKSKQLSVAAINGPSNTVVAGELSALTRLEHLCDEHKIRNSRLPVSHAFHSPLMEPILAPLEQIAKRFQYSAPKITFLSNLTGRHLENVINSTYWRDHARQPVRFQESIMAVAEDGCQMLEIGPGHTLTTMAGLNLAGSNFLALQSLDREKGDWYLIGESIARLFEAGRTIDWQTFYNTYGYHRLNMPGYSFDRKSYWFGSGSIRTTIQPTTPPTTTRNHPLLAERRERDNGFSHVPRLDPVQSDVAFLQDHIIYDLPILPVVALLEMLSWASECHFGKSVVLENLIYRKAMVSETDCDITYRVDFIPNGSNTLAVSAIDKYETLHLAADIRTVLPQTGEPSHFDSATVTDGLISIPVDKFYNTIRIAGLNYGEQFRNIRQLWQGPKKAISWVVADKVNAKSGFKLHPVFLDACLHIFPALVPAYGDLSDPALCVGDGYLPTGIDRFEILQSGITEAWVYARRCNDGPDEIVIDIEIYGKDSHLVASIHGISLRRLPRSLLLPDRFLEHLYRPEWRPVTKLPEESEKSIPAGHWLILADEKEIGIALSDDVYKHGGKAVIVIRSDHTAFDSENNAETWSIDAIKDDDYVQLIAATKLAFGVPPDHISFLWGIDANSTSVGDTDTILSIVESLLALCRAASLDPDLSNHNTRISVVTDRAAPVSAGASPQPSGGPLWGLWRSFALEYPIMAGKLLDISINSRPNPKSLARIIHTELTVWNNEPQVARRGEHRFGLRIARVPDEKDSSSDRFFVPQKQASYLITGGLGALGLQVADWLSRGGAGRIILVGRSTPSVQALESIRRIELQGTIISVLSADVTSPSDVDSVMTKANTVTHPLKGIFHAAGGLDDCVIAQMDRTRFRKVLLPKVLGSWNLHNTSLPLDLDCFVLFSSILGLMGSAGQANYAAANTYLDALVSYRRALGLSACALQWGPWADTGLATHSGSRGEQIWRRRGTQYLPAELALKQMHTILSREFDLTAITITDWSVFLKQFPKKPTIFQELAPLQRDIQGEVVAQAFGEQIAAADPDTARALLIERITAESATVLGINPNELSPEQSLNTKGFDSLMAVELFNRLSQVLPWKLPMARVLTGPSVVELVTLLLPMARGDNDNLPTPDKQTKLPQTEVDNESCLVFSLRRPKAAIKLFCFSYAGGGPGIYKDWQEHLPDHIEVASILMPGRSTRIDEVPLTRISKMISGLLPQLISEIDRPFAFFGHCMGAIVMYETARRLKEDHGIEAVHLFASGAQAPASYTIPFYFKETETQLLTLLKLIDFRATQVLIEDNELRRLAMPVLRADLEAAAYYAKEDQFRTLDTPVTAFGGWQDMYAAPHGVDGWREFTTGSFELNLVPGNHYFLETEQSLILERIANTLLATGESVATVTPSLTPSPSADEMFSLLAIGDAVRRYLPKVATTAVPPSLPLQSIDSHSQITLYCFPPAWVPDLNTNSWNKQLPREINVQEIPHPGHGDGSASAFDLAALIGYADSAIGNHSQIPFAFFGHGLGAIIAYEVANRRAERGADVPKHLFLAAVPSPDAFVFPWVHLQPDEKLLEMLTIINWPGNTNTIDKAQLAILRADFAAYASYRHRLQPPLPIPITHFTYNQDLWVSQMVAHRWNKCTNSKFRSFHRNGDHFLILKRPCFELNIIAEELIKNTFTTTIA